MRQLRRLIAELVRDGWLLRSRHKSQYHNFLTVLHLSPLEVLIDELHKWIDLGAEKYREERRNRKPCGQSLVTPVVTPVVTSVDSRRSIGRQSLVNSSLYELDNYETGELETEELETAGRLRDPADLPERLVSGEERKSPTPQSRVTPHACVVHVSGYEAAYSLGAITTHSPDLVRKLSMPAVVEEDAI